MTQATGLLQCINLVTIKSLQLNKIIGMERKGLWQSWKKGIAGAVRHGAELGDQGWASGEAARQGRRQLESCAVLGGAGIAKPRLTAIHRTQLQKQGAGCVNRAHTASS